MANMRYSVRVLKVAPNGSKARADLVNEFDVEAANIDAVRKLVQKKVKSLGHTLRSLSFSPDPKPAGSVLVYVAR